MTEYSHSSALRTKTNKNIEFLNFSELAAAVQTPGAQVTADGAKELEDIILKQLDTFKGTGGGYFTNVHQELARTVEGNPDKLIKRKSLVARQVFGAWEPGIDQVSTALVNELLQSRQIALRPGKQLPEPALAKAGQYADRL